MNPYLELAQLARDILDAFGLVFLWVGSALLLTAPLWVGWLRRLGR